MIPLGSKLAPSRGSLSWNDSNREGRIHFVGKLTQVSDSGPSWPSCYMNRSLTHWKYTDETSNIASEEEIMEDIYRFVVLCNLSVISHRIFPKSFFWFLAQTLKITQEAT